MEEVDERRREEADQDQEQEEEVLAPSFPSGRVKRIIKLDGEINKLTSEAVHLISLSVDLFLGFLAERAKNVTVQKKRKTINLEYLRSAVSTHTPTSDFLLDCLPGDHHVLDRTEKTKKPKTFHEEKPLPRGVQRIDGFFKKTPVAVAATAAVTVDLDAE
ncbi:Nuclear factor Y, subunit C13 [Zostera marina]|uniref:Nuclear factor Y, subunit C13 n=1 Tax=Zostera marina TaxID=29655 RepID=A0A0K9NHH6_ZOSMR|nr:Nuclear factor Y, subunit C13 [Zostera marina]